MTACRGTVQSAVRRRAPSLLQSLCTLLSSSHQSFSSARSFSLGCAEVQPLGHFARRDGGDGGMQRDTQILIDDSRNKALSLERAGPSETATRTVPSMEFEASSKGSTRTKHEDIAPKTLLNPRDLSMHEEVPSQGNLIADAKVGRPLVYVGSASVGLPEMSIDAPSAGNPRESLVNPRELAEIALGEEMEASISGREEWKGLAGPVEGRVDSCRGGRELLEDCSAGDTNLSKRLKMEVTMVPRVVAAWEHWKKLGEPKLVVAPMVDQSELPFRMLCRKYGATAAYTPMFHSRLFAQDAKYRKEFTTCPEDRPLFVQFCANNPDTLLEAARNVQDECDYVDINFGCPQRIAKRGNYGAFLMDDLPLVRSLVANLASNLTTPVSCKIRVFPELEDTLAYARMLEEAGCSLLAVHGRTREQKSGKAVRADWDAIKAVKSALSIPVLANGNIRWLEDVYDCIEATGVDGVMSAESLLENPAIFLGHRMKPLDARTDGVSDIGNASLPNEPSLVLEYLELCEKYPVPTRMIRAHVHRMLGSWFRQHPELREEFNKQFRVTTEWLKEMVHRLVAKHKASAVLSVPSENGTFKHLVENNPGRPANAVIVEPLRGEALVGVTVGAPNVVPLTPSLV